jgi:hypothetical protein
MVPGTGREDVHLPAPSGETDGGLAHDRLRAADDLVAEPGGDERQAAPARNKAPFFGLRGLRHR